jgi:hypothetical protein
MNNEIGSVIRSILKIGGGVAVSKGIADESTVETAVAGIAAIIGIVWGIVAARRAKAVAK